MPDSAELLVTFDPIEENDTGLTDGEGRLAAIPVSLMTAGWDAAGSPLDMPEHRSCSTALLELPQVVQWFVSHERHHTTRVPKVSQQALLLFHY